MNENEDGDYEYEEAAFIEAGIKHELIDEREEEAEYEDDENSAAIGRYAEMKGETNLEYIQADEEELNPDVEQQVNALVAEAINFETINSNSRTGIAAIKKHSVENVLNNRDEIKVRKGGLSM